MYQNDRHALYLGLGAVALWSTVATAFKLSLYYLNPLQLIIIAVSVSWFFFALRFVNRNHRDALLKSTFREKTICLFMGWINPGLYYLILFSAYDRLPAQEAMAINYSWGITLAIVAAILLKQTLSLRALLAASISYMGILVIATHGDPFSLEFVEPWGVGLALLSTLIWSLYWVLNTRLNMDPEVSLFLNFSGAIPVLLLITLLRSEPFLIPWQGWLGGLYIGLFEMGIAFVMWMGAMKAASSTIKISSLIFLSPPLSLLFIRLFTQEALEFYTLVGLGLILGGLWIQHRFIR